MNKKIIIGNWKMNPGSLKEAEGIFKKISQKNKSKKIEVVVCPPFGYLAVLSKYAKKVSLGAQDVSGEERGAFTGQISAEMLSNLGVKYVIVGHSERRRMGEKNEEINKKIRKALFFGITPVLCVGEEVRDANHGYFNIVKNQVVECLDGINKNLIAKIIIAYEPVWALSTTPERRDAVPADSHEMVIFIKKVLSDKFGSKTNLPRIIYGGSVNEKNIAEFLQDGGVDGALPGAASLNPEKFLEIINIAEKI